MFSPDCGFFSLGPYLCIQLGKSKYLMEQRATNNCAMILSIGWIGLVWIYRHDALSLTTAGGLFLDKTRPRWLEPFIKSMS